MLSFVVASKPAKAGIDPYHKLIDRHYMDNVKAVAAGKPRARWRTTAGGIPRLERTHQYLPREIIALRQFLQQPHMRRLPAQPLLRKRAGGHHIQAGKAGHPAKILRRFCGRF